MGVVVPGEKKKGIFIFTLKELQSISPFHTTE